MISRDTTSEHGNWLTGLGWFDNNVLGLGDQKSQAPDSGSRENMLHVFYCGVLAAWSSGLLLAAFRGVEVSSSSGRSSSCSS